MLEKRKRMLNFFEFFAQDFLGFWEIGNFQNTGFRDPALAGPFIDGISRDPGDLKNGDSCHVNLFGYPIKLCFYITLCDYVFI